MDAEYEASKKGKNGSVGSDESEHVSQADSYSNTVESKLSQQSLFDFFTNQNKNEENDVINIDSSSMSSDSSGDKKPAAKDTNDGSAQPLLHITNNPYPNQEDNRNMEIISVAHELHIPDNFNSLYYSSIPEKEKEEELNKFPDYLTDSLIQEMSQYYPTSEDMKKDPLTNDVVMDKTKFELNFNKIFPLGRLFLNYVQLREAVKEFFEHWNLVSKANGKKIRCSYSHTPAKKKDAPETNTRGQRSKRKSTPFLMQCPFELRFRLFEHKSPHRHDVFYKVKISNIVSTKHTCMMSHISYRHALSKSTGHTKINLTSMNTAVSVLKMNPSMPAQMLRPLLKNCLPCNVNLDAKFIDNYRRRVAIHHAKNPNQPMITMEQCHALSNPKPLDRTDLIGMNDPLIRSNLNAMYGRIMQNDSNVWSALQFLSSCKKTIYGFDYRVLRSTTGNPTALLYMTSRMRYNLLRYGNIIFIDGQKRKYNKLNWPYIGPVIKNSDNRIGVTCEAIVTSEDLDTYTWIFKSMTLIEPRWSLSKIQIIYGDGLITKTLLQNLGISNTCILHGDYFHLYKENWPQPQNFGIVVFKLIKAQLSTMLLSKTKSEWDKAFEEASVLLQAHPLKLELLEKIHSDPQYYAGYVTREIVGNLHINGTAPAEQNHASIVAFNGNGMLGSIMDHLKALCERQQQLCNKENNVETEDLIRSNYYKPTLDGEMAVEDINARRALSSYPHKQFYILQTKSSDNLQSLYDHDTSSHMVWPAGVDFNSNDPEHVIIKVGERCNCWRRVDYDIQCKHELKINFKFNLNHWGHRWFNRRQFNSLYPNLSTFDTNPEVIDVESDNDMDNNLHNQDIQPLARESNSQLNRNQNVEVIDVQEDTVFNSILDKHDSKVTYKDVLEIATDLCRTVADDAKLCKNTYGTLFEWITKIREGEDFEVCFRNRGLPKDNVNVTIEKPLAAVITPKVNGRRKRSRYKSSEEIRRGTFKAIRLNDHKDRMTSLDEMFVTPVTSEKKYCFLCRQPKCTRWTCNVLKSYEKVPGRILPKGHVESRDKLINLISTVDNHVLCFNRSSDDERMIYSELPTKIKAMVVHKKFIIEGTAAHISPHDNVCIECTLLGNFGIPMEKYSEALFKKNCVTRFLGKSSNNLVVDNLS